MTAPNVLDALGIPRDADATEQARCLRRLAGLPEESSEPTLWRRFLNEIEGTLRFPGGNDGDGAELANNVVGCAIAAPGDPDEVRYGLEVWEDELGAPRPNADEFMREFVIDEVAPRLQRAGLYRLH